MELKDKLQALLNDPRRVLKTIRMAENPISIYCNKCNELAECDPKTVELSRRIDKETLIFFCKCSRCGRKFYWRENHC